MGGVPAVLSPITSARWRVGFLRYNSLPNLCQPKRDYFIIKMVSIRYRPATTTSFFFQRPPLPPPFQNRLSNLPDDRRYFVPGELEQAHQKQKKHRGP
jgi:hypothetical protein